MCAFHKINKNGWLGEMDTFQQGMANNSQANLVLISVILNKH